MAKRALIPTLFLVVPLFLGACGGGNGNGGDEAGDGNGNGNDDGNGNGGGQTLPLQADLAQGATWTFAWNSTTLSFAQGSGTSSDADNGEFTVTLGAPVTIAGETAYPLTFTGDAGDFLPRWTHVAISANGSLLGSTDGVNLQTVYNAETGNWVGGGFFIEFASNESVGVSAGIFDGEYNTVPALVASHSSSDGGCETILGITLCDDTTTRFSENEYYKAGIGPIGYDQDIFYSSDGGGFFTSTTIDRTVELVGTSLSATDNTVFNPPPWQRMASLATPRSGHSTVVLNGEIYVVGGAFTGGLTNTVEIDDPVSNQWRAGSSVPLTGNQSVNNAAVVDGVLYVDIFGSNSIQAFNGTSWTTVTPNQGFDGSFGDTNAATYTHPGLGPIIVGVESGGSLDPVGFAPAQNIWIDAPSRNVIEWLRPAVAVLGDQMYVIGGFGSGTPRGALDSVERHGLEDEIWTTTGIAEMGTKRDGAAVATLGGRIYVFGGNPVSCGFGNNCNIGAAFRTAEVYDPVANTWTPITSMFAARTDAAAVALNGDIYVIGGSGGERLASVERFTPR